MNLFWTMIILYKFCKSFVPDSSLDDSEGLFVICPKPSEEECSLIRFNLINDDCMKLDAEERRLYEKMRACSAYLHEVACMPDSFNFNACPTVVDMSACSASEHDFACLPDSFNSNACPSESALSLSSAQEVPRRPQPIGIPLKITAILFVLFLRSLPMVEEQLQVPWGGPWAKM